VTDPELEHLASLDESSLLMQIALADNAELALYGPEDLIAYGRATVERLLPLARALICPHRAALDAPEVEVIMTSRRLPLGRPGGRNCQAASDLPRQTRD